MQTPLLTFCSPWSCLCVLREAWQSYATSMGDSRCAYGPAAAWPTLQWSRKLGLSQYKKRRHLTCSAFPQCITHRLHSVLLLGKNFVSRMSTGRRKGRFKAESKGALPSAIINHRVAYSHPAFKSFVEDLWPVTKWCSFSGIHCVRDLLL